jgi:acylphosphatase
VFFRASTARRAGELGIVGYARNLADGRVEVLAFGAPGQLEDLAAWLEVGPPAARVEHVDVQETALPDRLPAEFSVR